MKALETFLLTQRCALPPAITNVENGSSNPSPSQILTLPHKPSDTAIGSNNSVLNRVGLPRLNALLHNLLYHGGIFRVNDAGEGADLIGNKISGRIAGNCLNFIADKLHCPISITGTAVNDSWSAGRLI